MGSTANEPLRTAIVVLFRNPDRLSAPAPPSARTFAPSHRLRPGSRGTACRKPHRRFTPSRRNQTSITPEGLMRLRTITERPSCFPHKAESLVTERVHTRATGECVCKMDVEAFDPGRHTARGDLMAQRFDGVPLREVRLMRPPIRGRQLGVLGEPVRHL